MKITQSEVKQVGTTTYEQEITYRIGQKRRREIFVAFSREKTLAEVNERVKELRRQS
jgi:hypothetical protein